MFAGLIFAAISVIDVQCGDLDGYYSGGWNVGSEYPWVFCGNQPMRIAREPDEGFWTFQGEDNVPAADLPREGGYSLSGYWTYDWAFETLRVDGVNPNGTIRFKDQHAFGIGKPSWGAKDRRYYAVNHKSFLNAPGEWWLDAAAGKLYFIPLDDDSEIRFCWEKKPALGLYNRHGETIRGRTIAFGAWCGIEIRGCSNLTIADCTIECFGGYGIDIGGDCHDIVITNCVIRNIGSGGVLVNGRSNQVIDCEICDFGLRQRVYAPGVRLYGESHEVRCCRIHAAPHSAIIYNGKDHLIAGNEIWDVIRETGDAGAIYTGRDLSSKANRIVGNYIHDLGDTVSNGKPHDVFTMGIYIDDCDCNETLLSNRIVNAGCAIMLGGGSDLVVKYNDISRCRKGIHLDDRGVTWNNDWIKSATDPHYPLRNDISNNKITDCACDYDMQTGAAFKRALADYFSDKTHLYYHTRQKQGEGAREDCAILNGVALAYYVEKWDREMALKTADGLLRLATVHGVPGFVCRGLEEDGVTYSPYTSRDQYTHFIHGLLRYYLSGLADDQMKERIRGAFAAVADRMIRNVTETNNWNALTADGEIDQKGVLKMWNVQAHEAARLPAIYAAAWKVTGDEKYKAEYLKYADAAIEQSWKISEQRRAEVYHQPGYAFLQMNASLETMYLCDSERANRIQAVMKECAQIAAGRFVDEKGANGPWLSFAGDLASAVAMTAKFVSTERLLGPDLYNAYRELLRDCFWGINGQPMLAASVPARALSVSYASILESVR